jgi:DNA-binding LacI/PurR family transcriptional regulator
VPNLAARTLAGRRSGVVGMIVGTLTDPLAAAVACAVDRALDRAGYTLAIATGGASDAEVSSRVRELLGRGVDALLSWEGSLPPAGRAAGRAQHVPWIAFGESGETAGAVPAEIGRRKGAVLTCRYLASLGHARVGAISTVDAAGTSAMRETLGASGGKLLTPEPRGRDAAPEEVREAARAVLDLPEPPTAVVCSSDLHAAMVLRECHRRGIDVPRELSIIGFGDSELARETWPALTTLRVPTEEIGAWAAKALVAMLRGVVPAAFDPAPKLVIRESTAEAPR